MKLLVTNDDGIGSAFLHELIFALKAAGHQLYVVAPATEQSWSGASKTRNRPVKSSVVDRGFGCPTWTVDGTPSDCVNIAIAHLLPEPVAGVISGINLGFNCSLGFILASGTVAGAWEGRSAWTARHGGLARYRRNSLCPSEGTRRGTRCRAACYAQNFSSSCRAHGSRAFCRYSRR